MVVIAVGVLGAQAGLDADPDEAIEVMRVNFLGVGSLLLECLRQLRRRGEGTLVLLSSVAAERPRASNPIYGAAKAGLDALAQGLSDAIASSGVRVLVVRPGFVKTRMTADLAPVPFATTPEVVASATVAALSGRAETIWVPGRLRLMFAILRHLPRGIYRRLPFETERAVGRHRDRDHRGNRRLDDHPRPSGRRSNRDCGTGRVRDQLTTRIAPPWPRSDPTAAHAAARRAAGATANPPDQAHVTALEAGDGKRRP